MGGGYKNLKSLKGFLEKTGKISYSYSHYLSKNITERDTKMPILKFYTSRNQLTSVEKQELATVLTNRYASFMPAFYVNIIFHEVSSHPFSPLASCFSL